LAAPPGPQGVIANGKLEPQALIIRQSGNRLIWSEPTTANRFAVDLRSLAVTITGNAPKDLKVTVTKREPRVLEMAFSAGDIHGTSIYEISEDDSLLTARTTTVSADGVSEVKALEYVRQ